MEKLHQGIDLYLTGDHAMAIKILKEFIAEYPNSSSVAYYHIGLAYSDLGKLTDATEYLNKAIEIEPEKSMYHYRLGLVYSRLMILDSGIVHLNKAIELNPEHQRARYLLGTIYFKRGDIKEARDTFANLIQTSPDFAAAYYHRALCLYHLGDDDGAILDLEKAVSLNPEYSESLLKLGSILAAKKKFAKASEYYKQVFELGIRDCVFLKGYASSLIAEKKKEEAKNILNEALFLYPHNVDIMKLSDELK